MEPDFFQVELKADDVLIICSDGLYDEVPNETLIELIEKNDNMSTLSGELVDKANENGGHDNVTVISLKVQEDDIDE